MASSARLEELQQKFNENPRRYFAPLANEHRKLGDLTQAITLCRTHLPQQPQHVSGHIVLAQALFEAGDTPDARQTFELALDLDPENLIALRFLGDIARAQGDHLTARQWYERVLDADPRNDEIARLVREIENGAAAAVPAAAERVQESAPAITEPEPHPAYVPNEPEAESPAAPVASEPVEDLATAWQHEVAALDAPSQVPAPAYEPEPEPEPVSAEVFEQATVEQSPEQQLEPFAETPEPIEQPAEAELEPIAESPEPVDAGAVAAETPAAPNEPRAEPDEEFVASVPTVEATTQPAPPVFAEIDYSLFEAVADEEEVAAAPAPEPSAVAPAAEESAASEVPHASGDDWFAMPSGREAEVSVVESAAESSFDLDAAFQQVLPNRESEEEVLTPQGSLADFNDLPHSREWEVTETPAAIPEEPSFSAPVEGADSVDDAFAELDRMTASLEADASSSAMLLPDDEYTAAEPAAEPQHVDALIGRTPESGVSAVESAPIAFVTETMAELYLQQGFREEALAVYRQLLSMNEGDAVLAARVQALEGGDAQTPPSEEEATSFESYRMAPAAHADATGQSMRAFLGVFARRRAPMRRRERVAAEVPSVVRQPETGLSALFGGSQGNDDGVAAVLAGAFAQPNAEALPGRPTRAAAQELSLGDVFGGGSGGATNGGRAASFDEFFSTGTADQSVRSPLDEEGSDMEQFTAWLEGLKKK
ncbi:MAG: tetratricopeptide repeat protein [Gemmatimonadaceae bacterium]